MVLKLQAPPQSGNYQLDVTSRTHVDTTVGCMVGNYRDGVFPRLAGEGQGEVEENTQFVIIIDKLNDIRLKDEIK